jgi:hypothetical protein
VDRAGEEVAGVLRGVERRHGVAVGLICVEVDGDWFDAGGPGFPEGAVPGLDTNFDGWTIVLGGEVYVVHGL